jgi:hypothetical protein
MVMENITADYSTTNLSTLKNRIDSVNYSTNPLENYSVVQNKFIKFDASGMEKDTDPGDAENLLKVTIKNESGSLTTFFTN